MDDDFLVKTSEYRQGAWLNNNIVSSINLTLDVILNLYREVCRYKNEYLNLHIEEILEKAYYPCQNLEINDNNPKEEFLIDNFIYDLNFLKKSLFGNKIKHVKTEKNLTECEQLIVNTFKLNFRKKSPQKI